jgi:poly(hydroxyalkanoate) depolymerase family esterase
MKYDTQLMTRLQAATQQILRNGPAASAAAMQQAFGATTSQAADDEPSQADASTLKDLNAAPDYARKAAQAFGARRAQAQPAENGAETPEAPASDLAGFLAGLGVHLPRGAGMGEGFKLPEGFQLPEGIELPEGLAPMRKRPAAPPPIPPGATFDSANFTNHGGTRAYKLYVPSTYVKGTAVPLVVMLHGCTQDPDDFAAGTKMNQIAEETGCLVLYPAQSQQANQSKCWNWFSKNDQQYERGEPAIIAGMTRDVMARYTVDPARVSIAGLSAGGAMAVIVGALYPELFQAVGVHSGLPFGAAQDLPAALQAMKQGSPGRRGHGRRPVPRPLIVFHGDKDHTVHAVNAEHVLADALAPHGAGRPVTEQGKALGGRRYTRTTHHGAGGAVLAEHWSLHGGGHAWAGGSPAGSYTDCRGPDASREMMRFFQAAAAGGAGTA